MNKLKIYLYSTQDIGHMGGGGNSSSTTFKYLEKAGHEVIFFKSFKKLEKSLSELKPDILLHHNIRGLDKVYELSQKFEVPLITTINNLVTCPTGDHIKYDNKFCVPCNHCDFFSGFLCQLKEKNVRNFQEKSLALLTYPLRYLHRNKRLELLNKVDGVIAISPTLAKLLVKNGVKREVYMCQQPVDNELLVPPESLFTFDKKTIFYQGGGEPFKGVRVLIEAFNKLDDDSAELLIAGDVRPENNLDIGKICKQNLNIKFLGQVTPDEMKKYYYSTDIFIFPSLWLEGYGRGWAEAACCGKPIITFKGRGGSSDFLTDNVDALVINTTIKDLVSAMHKLLNDSNLRVKLGQSALSLAKQKLIASQVIKKLEIIYEKVLKNV